jgi:hypothetical protein
VLCPLHLNIAPENVYDAGAITTIRFSNEDFASIDGNIRPEICKEELCGCCRCTDVKGHEDDE